jgi:hypothetical protein
MNKETIRIARSLIHLAKMLVADDSNSIIASTTRFYNPGPPVEDYNPSDWQNINLESLPVSRHYQEERQNREDILQRLGGIGEPLCAIYLLYDGRPQVHIITSNSIVVIVGWENKRIISKLFAQPYQLSLYDGYYDLMNDKFFNFQQFKSSHRRLMGLSQYYRDNRLTNVK